jgi:hypothetical protein
LRLPAEPLDVGQRVPSTSGTMPKMGKIRSVFFCSHTHTNRINPEVMDSQERQPKNNLLTNISRINFVEDPKETIKERSCDL